MIVEDIYAALFALIWDGDTFKNDVSTARTLRHWSDVPPEERPAMFMAQGKRTVAQTAANGLPTRWYLDANLYVYVTTSDPVVSPGTIINPILDVIIGKLEANQAGFPQKLGGLVQWARIEGAIDTSEGTLGPDEVAIIPVRMLAV